MLKIVKKISLIILSISFVQVAFAQQILNLAEGEAQTIDAQQGVSSVFIADPSVADYQVIDKHKVVVFGKKIGSTSLLVFNDKGQQIETRTLIVNKSLAHIQQQIQLNYPNADVTLDNIGEQVVLTGTVDTEQERDEINILTGELLAKSSEDFRIAWISNQDEGDDDDYVMEFMTRRHFKGLVNNIKLTATKQVNVKLTIAEVSHSFLENFGIEYNNLGVTPGTFVNLITHFSASEIVSVITAIGDDSVGQILAEPNLSVISGESASFLVGGEMPMIVDTKEETRIEYKEFGISLKLMAKVLTDDKINLSLIPEVSARDEQYSDGTFNIPSFKTRRASTTVELGNGQSFVLGGLLSSEDSESVKKIPFVGDIPILGAIFRKVGTKRTKTELIIVATVNLVEPIHSSQIKLPSMTATTTMDRFFALEEGNKRKSEQWANDILAAGGFKK